MDLVEYYRILERRLARLERGTQGNTGGDDPTVVTSLAISGLTLTTQTTIGADDFYRVMLRYGWSAVPDDPSEYNKDPLDGYLTSWTLDGTHWTADLFTTTTSVDVGPFTQNQTVTFRVRARTKKGTLGAYSTISNTTTTDATAPFQPSTPVVSPYLGQLAIDWNGLDVSAGQPPTDFRFVEVHISTTSSTFTPTVSTLVGTILRGGGTWVATGLTYGTTYFARLVAVDTVGNRSPASTAGSAIPVQAANGDISALAVGKLTAGVITAVMTITGRLATALTGVRAEMNSSGFQAFNSAGAQTFDVNASSGAVTITGAFRTDFPGSGSAYLDMTSVTDRTTINFYDTTGTNPAFINSPADGSGNPRLGLNTGAFTYNAVSAKHRLFMNNAGGIQLESYRVPGGAIEGASLGLGPTSLLLDVRTNGTQDGGSYYADRSFCQMWTTNTGTMVSGVLFDDNATILLTGSFINNYSTANAARDAIIAGSNLTLVNGITGIGITYGGTATSLPGVVCSYYGTSHTMVRMNAMTTTGFAVNFSTITSGGGGTLQYWAYRQI
jgi:hypothetical protein